MSGGVDSSASAALLKKPGYRGVGVTMKMWNEEQAEVGCCSFSAIDDAKNVAHKLGIEHYVLDYEKQFDNKVVKYFIDENGVIISCSELAVDGVLNFVYYITISKRCQAIFFADVLT